MVFVLPAAPSFAGQIGEQIGQLASGLAQKYAQKKALAADEKILQELMNPNANRSAIQNIVMAQKLSPARQKSLVEAYTEQLKGEQKGKADLDLQREKNKMEMDFLNQLEGGQDPSAYSQRLQADAPVQPVDEGSPLNQPAPMAPMTSAAPNEPSAKTIQNQDGIQLGDQTTARPGLSGSQDDVGRQPLQKFSKSNLQKLASTSGTASKWANQKLKEMADNEKNAIENKKIDQKQEIESHKLTEKYRTQLSDDFRSYKNDMNRFSRLESLNDRDELVKAMPKKIMDTLGVPLSVWGNPDSEEYEKLVADMTKSAQDYYQGRITNFELESFMKTLPTLLNSKEGRRRILNNLRILKEPVRLEHEAYDQVMKEWKAQGNKGYPLDLRERIDAIMLPQLDAIADQFETDKLYRDPSTGKLYNIPPDKQKMIPKEWESLS